jgi:hypothetical protein
MSIVSLVHPGSEITLEELEHEVVQVWEGSERDWQCVRRLLRHLGRDGRKLELWRMWLGPYARECSSDIKGKGKQSSPDVASSEKVCQGLSDAMPGNPPPLVHLATLLKNHVRLLPHPCALTGTRVLSRETPFFNRSYSRTLGRSSSSLLSALGLQEMPDTHLLDLA